MPYQDVRGNLHSNIGEAISANIGFLGRVEGGKIQPSFIEDKKPTTQTAPGAKTGPITSGPSLPELPPILSGGGRGASLLATVNGVKVPKGPLVEALLNTQELLVKGIIPTIANYTMPDGTRVIMMNKEQGAYYQKLLDQQKLKQSQSGGTVKTVPNDFIEDHYNYAQIPLNEVLEIYLL